MGRPKRAAAGGLVYHVLNRANARMTLFEDEAESQRRRKLDRTLDAIRERFGHDSVSRGGS